MSSNTWSPTSRDSDLGQRTGFLEYIYIYLSIYLSNLFIFGCAVFIVARAFSLAVVSWGYSLVVVCGLLIAVSSLVAERGL